jgi:hypothetical protein
MRFRSENFHRAQFPPLMLAEKNSATLWACAFNLSITHQPGLNNVNALHLFHSLQFVIEDLLSSFSSIVMSCFGAKPARRRPASQISAMPPDYPTAQWLEEGKMRQSISSLTKTELSENFVTQDPPPVHIEDVWREVRALERHHFATSRYRQIGRTIEPVIDFFTRFSPVLDTMSQYGSNSATLVWGSLKAMLVV